MQIATGPMGNARNGKSVGSIVFIAVSGGSRWKRLEVRIHVAMCRFCSRLAHQVEQLRSAADARANEKRRTPASKTVCYGAFPDGRSARCLKLPTNNRRYSFLEESQQGHDNHGLERRVVRRSQWIAKREIHK